MKLGDLGEFGFLDRLRAAIRHGPRVEIGIGDDCAVVRVGRRSLLLTTDTLVEGVHFRRRWDTPDGLGWRAFAVNASDIAAMGGVPRFALLSVSVPPSVEVRDLEAFHRGFARAGRRFGCDLVGGNLTSSPRWMISVMLLGEPAGRVVTRAGAQPGDAIFVSGPVGGAARSRELLLGRRRVDPRRTIAFRRPVPRVALGSKLAGKRLATAMIDVSDGLLQDLGHLCRASRCGAVLEAAEVPHASSLRGLPPRRALSLALGGGEDYELVFTAPRFRESALCRLDRGIRRIGTIVRGQAIRVVDAAGRPLPPVAAGFDHFSRSSLSR